MFTPRLCDYRQATRIRGKSGMVRHSGVGRKTYECPTINTTSLTSDHIKAACCKLPKRNRHEPLRTAFVAVKTLITMHKSRSVAYYFFELRSAIMANFLCLVDTLLSAYIG
jgi:hypothetical protein